MVEKTKESKRKPRGLAKHLSVAERNNVDGKRIGKRQTTFVLQAGIDHHPPIVHRAIITEISERIFIELVDFG